MFADPTIAVIRYRKQLYFIMDSLTSIEMGARDMFLIAIIHVHIYGQMHIVAAEWEKYTCSMSDTPAHLVTLVYSVELCPA